MNVKLKKSLKITGITLGSILGVVLVTIAILCWVIFTPERLTKVAQKAVASYSPVRAELGYADLTLVSTYPFVEVRLNDLVVFDDMEGSPSDTLAAISDLTVTLDLEALYKESKIIVTNLYLEGVSASLFTDEHGSSNIDIIGGDATDAVESDSTDDAMEVYVDLQKLSVKGLQASFRDLSSGTEATVEGMELDMHGKLTPDTIQAKSKIALGSIIASINNDTTHIMSQLKGLALDGEFSKYGNLVQCSLTFNLKDTHASIDDNSANLNNLNVVLNHVVCLLGENGGMKELSASLDIKTSELALVTDGMTASSGSLSIKSDRAIYTTDSIKVADCMVDMQSLTLQIKDSVGNENRMGLDQLALSLSGSLKSDMSSIWASIGLLTHNMALEVDGANPMSINTNQLSLNVDGSTISDNVQLDLELSSPMLKFIMGDEVLVPNWPISVTLPVITNRTFSQFDIKKGAGVKVNGEHIGFDAKGSIGGDNEVKGIAHVKSMRNHSIEHLISMIPDSYSHLLDGIDIDGMFGFDVTVQGALDSNGPQMESATAYVELDGLDAMLHDTICAVSDRLTAQITYPGYANLRSNYTTADAVISATDFYLSIIDTASITACASLLDINASIAGIDQPKDSMSVALDLHVEDLSAAMDTICATMGNANVGVAMAPHNGLSTIMARVDVSELKAQAGNIISASLNQAGVRAMARYDETKDDILLKWDPNIKLTLDHAQVDMIQDPIFIPTLDMDFSLGTFNINECEVQIDSSNVILWGDVYNIGAYLDGTGLLTGELFVESDYLDVNRLMGLSAMSESSDMAVAPQESGDSSLDSTQDTITSGPFMIPNGINLTLYTDLSEIGFNKHTFNNVGGDVTIRDGMVVLQELGFSSKAAEMQLTAIYKTPSIEDRFMEVDFHLLDIEVDELIDLIPAVDSIMPMLKTFSGKAQFHLAAETFLEPDTRVYGDYFPVMSTLIGAAAIEGSNLVVMDNDVFNGIKRKLFMSKKAKNVIDSLDVELQVLRDKVDLYPTRIKMDRYQAIVSGRHNINKDLSCSYNVSLVECPLPIRLGVTLSGPINGIAESPLKHIKLGFPKYSKLYKPSKRGNTEEKVLKMKEDILQTLQDNVR